jgi:MFS family permease
MCLDANDTESKHLIDTKSQSIASRKYSCSSQLITKSEFLFQVFNNLKFTLSHLYLVLSIFLIKSIEGSEVLALSLSSKLIELNFDLPENFSVYTNLIVLSGNFTGSIISILLDKKMSRKAIILLGSAFIIFFGFISILSNNIYLFIITRHIVNMGIGLLSPAATALISESVNLNYRAFVLNFIFISSNIGEMFVSLSIDKDIVETNKANYQSDYEWRKLFMFTILPVK